MQHLPRFAVLSLALSALPAAAATDAASTSAFTEHTLLGDLGQRGLTDLIDRWAAEPPPVADPATARVLAAARAHGEEVAADAAARGAAARGDTPGLREAAEAAEAAFGRRLEALRALVRDPALATHPERALFAAELAETLLVGRLERRLRHADLFLAYGRPGGDHAEVANTLAEALAATQEAERAAGALRNRFGRDRAAEAAARADGSGEAVLVGVAERRAPLAAATAALGLATLPEGSPFFGGAPPVPLAGRLNEPGAERRRLLDLAGRSAQALLDGSPGGLAPAARLLLARVAAAEGNRSVAAAAFRDLKPELTAGRLAVVDRLGLAAAAPDQPTIDDAFREAADLAVSSGDPMLSLLVADAVARRALAADDFRAAAAAYSRLPVSLEPMVRQRRVTLGGEAGGGEVDPEGLPPLVAAAVARQALGAGDPARALAAATAAVAGFGDPARMTAGPELDAALGAASDLAAARAAVNPGDPAVVDTAIADLLRLARGFPRSVEAASAIARAADLATAAQAAVNLAEGPVADRYAEVMGLLFDRFGDSAAADRHRLYWAYAGHTLRGDDAGAAAVYELVPVSDPGRLDALALALSARERAAAAADSPAASASLLAAAAVTADRLGDEARQRAGTDPVGAVMGVGRSALGEARIELARGNPSSAAAGLAGLDQTLAAVSDQPAAGEAASGLLAEAAGLRVAAFLAAGEPDAAAAEAAAMMDTHAATAASVVQSVLADLSARADALLEQARGASDSRATELEHAAADVSASAVSLARLLLDDAESRGLSAAELLPWRLAYANGLTRSADPAGAIAFLEQTRVLEGFPSNAQALESAAEARFALAVQRTHDASGASFRLTDSPSADAAAREAAPLYDRLIRGLSATRPPAFWNAWARRLSISLALGEGVDRVALSVAQLEDQDPSLGGPDSAARLRAIRAAARQ